jgi:hypothetical protein
MSSDGVHVLDGGDAAVYEWQEAREALLLGDAIIAEDICPEMRNRFEELFPDTSVETSLACKDESHPWELCR